MIKKIAVISLVLLGLLGVVYVLIPNEKDEAAELTTAVLSDITSSDAPQEDDAGLVDVAISAKQVSVGFSCAKTVAGKTLVVRGGWSNNFGSEISGTVRLDPDSQLPEFFEASVRIDSLWSEHDQLTGALLEKGFFQPEAHPTATFDGRFVAVDEAHVTEVKHTHTVTGNFQLNGIAKRIEFPAVVEVSDDVASITSTFSLDRHAFDVKFKDTGGFGLLTDEDIAGEVAIRLRIDVPLKARAGEQIEPVSPIVVERTGTVEAQPVAEMPESFTETIPATQIQFDMVLVPGDAATGQEVFYVGRHEVTWDEFMPWVQGTDLGDEALVAEKRALKLRPSAPYGSVGRNFGMYRRPALGMSRMSAELYCKWLSEQTGHTYRLPTEVQWERAYRAGGGDPAVALLREDAVRVATYRDNAWDDSIGDWATTRVGQREEDGLGVHDLAGNVAEWVTGTGEEHVVRGGHFDSPLSELGVGRIVEDMDAWNRDYPNEPKSAWWYVNARWVGLRVVCETPPEVHPRE